MFITLLLSGCTTSKNYTYYGCKSKGYKVWYCGYERPQISYRAVLR